MNIRTSLVRQLPRIRALDMCDGHFSKPEGISSKAELADAVASSISSWPNSYWASSGRLQKSNRHIVALPAAFIGYPRAG